MTTFALFYKTNSIFMRRQLLFIYAFICVLSAWAAPRTQEQAAAIAQEFLAARKSSPVATRSGSHIRLAATSTDLLDTPSKRSASAQPAFYVYNRGTDAFVIISADDRMETVLGYSEDGAFVTEDLPENIKEWLNHYVQAYNRIDHAAEVIPVRQTSARAAFATQVSPLLGDIQYNQDEPYNNLCPLYAGTRCVTGCGATAMAQILRYWQYPAVGTGIKHYTTASHGIDCNYSFKRNPLDWDNILPSYNGGETTEQTDAVANLMLACGMASETDYSTTVSITYTHAIFTGFMDHLGFDRNMYLAARSEYTADEWMSLIKTELNNKRPIYYSGSSTGGGHAFVIDGYDREDKVHVNWGWGGFCNGYFEVLTLDATSGGIGGYTDSSYRFEQYMLVGLQPRSTTTTYTSYFRILDLVFPNKELYTETMYHAYGYNLYNFTGTFFGKIGLIAEKDGIQHVITQFPQVLEPLNGWMSLTFDVNIPDSLEDGIYSIYVASKANKETRWNKAHGDLMDPYSHTLVKNNNRCVISPNGFDENQLSGNLTLTHSLFVGEMAGIKATVKNENDTRQFFGKLGVLITDRSGNILRTILNEQALLNAGEEIHFRIDNYIDLPPGTYQMQLVGGTTAYYLCIGKAQTVSVKEAEEGIPTLEVQDITLDTDRPRHGESLTVRAKLSLTGTGSLNTTFLCHTLTPAGESEPTVSEFDIPFVENGVPADYEYPLDIKVESGIYTYSLLREAPMTWINETLYATTVTVLEASGVEDVESGLNKPVVWYVQGEDNLHVRTDAEIEDITIYGMDGQAVSRTRPDTAGNGEYLVPTGNTDKGGYIMVLREKGGKRHMIKFIR